MEYISLYHKGKTVATTVGSLAHEATVHQGPQGWWEVMAVNGLSDPFESLNVGDRISLPDA
jgi:hypothetical protein